MANVLALALTGSKFIFFSNPSNTTGPIYLLHFLISSAVSLLLFDLFLMSENCIANETEVCDGENKYSWCNILDTDIQHCYLRT